MLRGVNILADAVKVTLGPKGRNVVLDKSGAQSSPTASRGLPELPFGVLVHCSAPEAIFRRPTCIKQVILSGAAALSYVSATNLLQIKPARRNPSWNRSRPATTKGCSSGHARSFSITRASVYSPNCRTNTRNTLFAAVRFPKCAWALTR
jgi:hypothetical protein